MANSCCMGGCENVLPVNGKEKDKRGENLFFLETYTHFYLQKIVY